MMDQKPKKLRILKRSWKTGDKALQETSINEFPWRIKWFEPGVSIMFYCFNILEPTELELAFIA